MRITLAFIRRLLLLTLFVTALTGTAAAATVWRPPLRPLAVTRAFQPPPTPYASGHRGVDLGGRRGQAVFAAAAGEVSFAGRLVSRGVVVIVHGALRTTYEPVQPTVRRGSHVVGGQQIGTLQPGHGSCPTEACLHWGLLRADVYLNPMSVLSPGPVRLYPPSGIGLARSGPQAVTPAAAAPRVGVSGAVGPSAATWSLVALSGAGVLVAFRRR